MIIISSMITIEIIRAARDGDDAAQQVLHWAGEELGWLADHPVIRHDRGMENDLVEGCTSQGVFSRAVS
jgi:hypothetical protein